MRRTIDYPRISVRDFRTAGNQIRWDDRRTNFVQGSLTWITSEGEKVVAIYDFGLLEKTGYLCLRYYLISSPIEFDYSIQLVPEITNYGHKRWLFVCPDCARHVKDLYYIEGPKFTCKFCGRLNPTTTIHDLPKIKREARFGSPDKKIRALEKLIKLREAVKRSRPQF